MSRGTLALASNGGKLYDLYSEWLKNVVSHAYRYAGVE